MLKSLKFGHHVFMDPNNCIDIKLTMNNYIITVEIENTYFTGKNLKKFDGYKRILSPEDSKKVREMIEDCGLETWYESYSPEGDMILDGFSWSLEYQDTQEILGTSKKTIEISGSNAYPWCFYKLIRALILACPESKEILETYSVEKKAVYFD